MFSSAVAGLFGKRVANRAKLAGKAITMLYDILMLIRSCCFGHIIFQHRIIYVMVVWNCPSFLQVWF